MSRVHAPSGLSKRQPLYAQPSSYASGSSSNSNPYASSSTASLPPSGRSSPFPPAAYGSSGLSGVNGNGSRTSESPFSSRSVEDLEGQNDERLEGLMGKVRLLKDITVGITEEVKEGNFDLTSMNDAFASTSHLLRGTMRRMTTMAKNQGGRWCWFMLFLMFVTWIFVVLWFFRR
ncbi:hypothetical protein BDY24DRAFT_401114 [Mrakia frigida]|uniref:SNARE domain- containing protein n=1 Tax=Mrakia frigida TaxID=29902 RepID=UPI003FCC222D